MTQNPLKKINLQKKPSKYKKVLKNPQNPNQILSKRINKKIIERSEMENKIRNINKTQK